MSTNTLCIFRDEKYCNHSIEYLFILNLLLYFSIDFAPAAAVRREQRYPQYTTNALFYQFMWYFWLISEVLVFHFIQTKTNCYYQFIHLNLQYERLHYVIYKLNILNSPFSLFQLFVLLVIFCATTIWFKLQ